MQNKSIKYEKYINLRNLQPSPNKLIMASIYTLLSHPPLAFY